MGLGYLLDKIRENYLAQFREGTRNASKSGDLLTEVAMRDKKGKVLKEGELKLGTRLDMVAASKSTQQVIRVDSKTMLRFEPISFEWPGGLDIELGPFSWDLLTISLPDSPKDFKPLVTWFEKWFKETEDGNGELLGVVHFLSDPEKGGQNEIKFEIDLGSAPVEAFEELLDALTAFCDSVKLGDT